MTLENLTGILSEIKEIKGVRFYFLVSIIFIFSIIFLFRQEIIASVNKHVDSKELKLRHADNNKIRHVIENVYDSTKCMAYILYLYQPDKPVIKRLEMASTTELENDMRLNEFILSRQQFITDGLKRSNYLILDGTNPIPGTEKYHRINGISIPYIYIYGIRNTEDQIVGEIHFWLAGKLTDEEIRNLNATLSETVWYIY